MSWESRILELLSASLVRPFILVAAAFLVLRVFRVEHPASRHAVWAAVLAGLVLVPFASVIAPHVDVPALPEGLLPLAKQSIAVEPDVVVGLRPSHEITMGNPSESLAPPIQLEQTPGVSSAPSSPSPVGQTTQVSATPLSIGTILLWCYFAGVAAFATYRIAGWIMLRRLLSQSRPLRMKPLRECDNVAIPITVGILRPAVVLPSTWRRWNASTRRSILAHELAHIRRRDAWVLMLSRWAKCLFWFHPLVWWVSRKTSELAEMSCDAIAVRTASDAAGYARILLDFSGVVNRQGYRAALPGLAMVGRSPLSRRIDQLFAASTGKMRRLRRPGAVLALVGIPTLCAAATLGLTESVSRPLLQAKRIVSGRLEATLPAGLVQQPLPALALSFLGLAPPIPAPQQPSVNPQEFLDRNCISCHGSRSRTGNVSFEGIDLTQIRRDADLWEKTVRKLRSGLHATVSAATPSRLDPTAARSFVEWLEGELDRGAPPFMPPPGPHRLNRTEYGNAIRDIFSLEVNPALLLPGDDSTQGFDNIAATLNLIRPEQYRDAADRIVNLAISSPSRRVIFTCTPSQSSQEAALREEPGCVRSIIENLATRAYRRPVTAEDIDPLVAVYWAERQMRSNSRFPQGFYDYAFESGIGEALRTILTNRSFLYRTEEEPPNLTAGQSYRIGGMELASRLSFFLWSSAPDAQLIETASRGQLQDPAVLERETRRMLKDPRAEALTLNFAGQWLWLRNLQRVGPLPSYADFDEPLRQAMRRETELFFSSIVQEDRNVLDLVTADYTFLNERLARHYGIAGVTGAEFRRFALPRAFDVRRGLLGKASLLTTTSRADRTSLTTRGRIVLLSLLGVEVPPPPPNVLPLPEKLDLPMRRVMDQANAARADCVSCHKIFDPIGIALDNFDLAGKWRAQENGQTIDPVTDLIDGTKLSGPADVRNAILARSDLFTRTLTQKLLTYALGRRTGTQDMPLVRSIVRDAARDNNRFSAIVLGIVRSAPFQMNVKN